MSSLKIFLNAVDAKSNDSYSDVLKKWRKTALRLHPNKGGDLAYFQKVSSGRNAFEKYHDKQRITTKKAGPAIIKAKYRQKYNPVVRRRAYQKKKTKNAAIRKMKRQMAATKIQQTYRRQKQKVEFKKHFMAGRIQDQFRKMKKRGQPPSDWPTDLANDSTQSYIEQYMLGKKDSRPLPTSELIVTTNQCGEVVMNDSKKNTLLTKAQAIMHVASKGLMRSSNRGLLAWHSTGSGKTCTAACVMNAYWDTNKPIIFCTSIEAKVANPPGTFLKCLHKYFKKSRTLSQINRRVQFLSFAQLAHYAQLYKPSGPTRDRTHRGMILDNAMLIIDEVQNLFHPLPSQRKEHKAIENFLLNDQEKSKNLKIVILTATPGDNPTDIVKLLNIIRDRTHPKITSVNLSNSAKGLISYLNTNNDASKFPSVSQKTHHTTMSREQYVEYADAYNKDSKKTKGTKYFPLARKYSSTMLHLKDNLKLGTFSTKVERILQMIKQNNKDKQYIYSSYFENRGDAGILGIAKALVKFESYEVLTPEMAREMGSNPTPGKRFCFMITTRLKNKTDSHALLRIYNHPKNRNGEICQIMLASQKFNEGLDLKCVKQIHIMEPLLTQNMLQQTIGRARRYCSHGQYPSQKDWTVTVNHYISDVPKETTPKEKNTVVYNTKTTQKLQSNLNRLKGVRGKAEDRQVIKDLLGLYKTKKKLTKTKGANGHAPAIDLKVTQKSIVDASANNQILNTMRSQAIDCRVMNAFHNKGSNAKFQCYA